MSHAGTNVGISYQGRIVRPSGEAVNAGVVAFSLRIFDSNNNCLLWSEVQNLNMANTAGAFSLVVGSGTRTDGGSHSLKQVFINAGTLSGLTCATGTDYSPTSNEDRNLVVTFNDGGTVVALNPMPIKSAPFAMQADQVSGYGILNLAKISGAGSATTLSPFQFDFLAALAAPATASSTPCATNEIIKFNGTAWACAADATGGTPSDAGYGAKGVLQFNTDAATSGVSIASGVASLNTGISANQIPKLDASANLGVGIAPTTRLDVNGAITQRGMAAPAVSAAGTGRIYYDSTNNHFYYSENGGAYTQLSSATGALSSVTSISNSAGNITLAPVTTTGAVLINSGTPSVGAASGALVVTGGIGASGDIYSSASINAATTVTAGTSMYSPQLYGSASASGNIRIDGTSNTTKGDVLLATAGGNVGIGTATPSSKLDVVGNVNITGSYRAADGTQAVPSYSFSNDTNTGFYLRGPDNIGFALNGGPVASMSDSRFSSYRAIEISNGGSATNLDLSFLNSSSVNTGLFNPTTNVIAFANNGVEAMRISSSGNVGIGTASPAEKLHVYNSTNATNALTVGVSGSGNAETAAMFLQTYSAGAMATSGSRGWKIEANGNGHASGANDLNIAYWNGAAWRSSLYMDDLAGNVGIGTTAPTGTLHVVGGTAAATTNGNSITFQAQNAGSGNQNGGSIYLTPGTATGTGQNGAIMMSGSLVKTGVTTTAYTSTGATNVPEAPIVSLINFGNVNGTPSLLFTTSYNSSSNQQNAYFGSISVAGAGVYSPAIVIGQQTGATSYAERMRIDGSGNVGIGATTPGSKLDVEGNVALGNGSASTGAASIAAGDSATATGSGTVAIGFAANSSGTRSAVFGGQSSASGTYSTALGHGVTVSGANSVGIGASVDANTVSGIGSVGIFLGGANSSTVSAANTMSIMGGSVGIGNTAPGSLLHVGSASVGTGLAVANFQNVDGTCTITPASSGSGIACSSDERLKENFQDVTGAFAIERILQLQAVTYNFKTSSSDNRRTGYKAQEVQKIAPEFVRQSEDGLLQVYYDAFIPWITEAIKTLYSRTTGVENHQALQDRQIASKASRTEVDQLKIENAKLKAEVEKQKQENAAIKARIDKIEKSFSLK